MDLQLIPGQLYKVIDEKLLSFQNIVAYKELYGQPSKENFEQLIFNKSFPHGTILMFIEEKVILRNSEPLFLSPDGKWLMIPEIWRTNLNLALVKVEK